MVPIWALERMGRTKDLNTDDFLSSVLLVHDVHCITQS
jgi:hypothetical protein